MPKTNKIAVLQDKTKNIIDKIAEYQQCEKKLKAIEERKKSIEKEEKVLIAKKNECIKHIEQDAEWSNKYSLKLNKSSNNDDDKPKRTVESGMMKPKNIPSKCLTFLKKVVKDKLIDDEFFEKEYSYKSIDDPTVRITYKLENIDENHLMSQQALSCIVGNYLKHNNQYAENSNKIYKPDAMVIDLLNIKDNEEMTFEKFQTYTKRMYHNGDESSDDQTEEEPVKTKKSKKKSEASVAA
jgi:hypothetical protein